MAPTRGHDPASVQKPHAAKTTRVEDIVLTGCGRAYVFPADLPDQDRHAGLGHSEFRVGYVEPHDGAWQALTLGNRPLLQHGTTRPEALRAVIEDAGWEVLARLSTSRRPPSLSLPVAKLRSPDPEPLIVVQGALGRVLLTRRIGQSRKVHAVSALGTVWPTGGRIAALCEQDPSSEATFHRTHRDAVNALVAAAGYRRILAPGGQPATRRDLRARR